MQQKILITSIVLALFTLSFIGYHTQEYLNKQSDPLLPDTGFQLYSDLYKGYLARQTQYYQYESGKVYDGLVSDKPDQGFVQTFDAQVQKGKNDYLIFNQIYEGPGNMQNFYLNVFSGEWKNNIPHFYNQDAQIWIVQEANEQGSIFLYNQKFKIYLCGQQIFEKLDEKACAWQVQY